MTGPSKMKVRLAWRVGGHGRCNGVKGGQNEMGEGRNGQAHGRTSLGTGVETGSGTWES